jgi:hypothetical protein
MISIKLPAVVIFLGSFLLFLVQPMLGRTLLPSFGGTASVWVVCLCAYQVLLLAGYWYAHCVSKEQAKSYKLKAKMHIALLAVAVVWVIGFVLLRPVLSGSMGSSGFPALEVLAFVLLIIGVPYILLSANSTLVQAWVAQGEEKCANAKPSKSQVPSPKSNVYQLYAISNMGSFCGLLTYPFIFEPFVSLTLQWLIFAGGIVVYAGLLAMLAKQVGGRREEHSTSNIEHRTSNKAESDSCGSCHSDAKKTATHAFLWLALPATSCFLLNAVTTHLTLDVMPLPLLWVVVLALFLLSYMIGFSPFGEKRSGLIAVLAGVAFVGVCFVRGVKPSTLSFVWLVSVYCLFLFVACTFLHSWLYRVRPESHRLTHYYLLGAMGGAIGGVMSALVAPMIFKTVAEYPIALATLAVLVCAEAYLQIRRRGLGVAVGVVMLLSVVLGGVFFFRGDARENRPVIYRGRGFFGTIQVLESKAMARGKAGYVREFVHGTTIHGIQALLPGKERMPTAYYTPNAVGYAVVGHPKYRTGEPMRVNLVGLGVGVMLSYARPNDYYHAYEISKEVLNVATNTAHFTFVSGCSAKTDIILGDARKGLEYELAQGREKYDVIVLDAFTGDNIPYHLSTIEAFELYFKLLNPDGILVVNISNWHLNLVPFMKSVGDHFKSPLLVLEAPQNLGALAFAAKCAFFCRQPEGMGDLPAQARIIDLSTVKPMSQLPTDERGSFVELICY